MSGVGAVEILTRATLRKSMLSDAERTRIETELVELVAAKLSADKAPWYPGSSQERPNVQVYDATEENGRVTVRFIADHLIYCQAQSGSDWADHYVFVGEATFEGDQRIAANVALAKEVNLSELEEAEYRTQPIVAAVRDAIIAKSSVDDATAELLADVRAAVDAKVAKARAAKEPAP